MDDGERTTKYVRSKTVYPVQDVPIRYERKRLWNELVLLIGAPE